MFLYPLCPLVLSSFSCRVSPVSCFPTLTLCFPFLRSQDPSLAIMAPPQISLFFLGLLALMVQACPSRCRCYSLTVECGSIGLPDIPEGVPPSTQVWLPCCSPIRVLLHLRSHRPATLLIGFSLSSLMV